MSRRWLLVGGVACLAGLVAWVFFLARELAEAGRELVETTTYVAQMSSELATTRADADLLVDALAVLRAEGVRQVELRGRGTARGRAFVSSRGLVLLVDDLGAPVAGHVYQAWVGPPNAAPAGTGTFEVNPFGMATVVHFYPVVSGSTSVIVTTEPVGGSPAPTSRPVLAGP